MGDSEKTDLPVGWVTATIAELGSIFSGGTPSTKEPEYWGEEIRWISPSDLSGYSGKFISQGAKSLTKKGLENSSAKVMPAGSVHFSSRAPIGYVVISSEDMTTNQGFKSLVPATGIFNEYVYYYLKSAKKTAEDMASGTTFKEISGSAFSRLPVPLPPLPEQKRIVAKIEELFSELDKGIESFKTAREQLKVYRQALLKHAFEGKLTEKWRTENVGAIPTGRPGVDCTDEHGRAAEKGRAVGIAPTKHRKPLPPLTAEELAELPELPDGWGWVKLGNHAFVTKLAGFEFTKYVKYKDNGDIPVIRAQNVSKEGFVSKNFLYVDRAIMEQLSRSRVYGGEVLMVFVGAGLGQVGIVPDGLEYFLGPNVAKIALEDGLNNSFVCNFLSSTLGFGNVTGMSKATAQGSISMGNIREVFVPLAPMLEQAAIIDELESNLSEIDNLDQTIITALQQAEALRQSILKKAFSGQLVPQDPHDEPAAELLARIKVERQAVGAIPTGRPNLRMSKSGRAGGVAPTKNSIHTRSTKATP